MSRISRVFADLKQQGRTALIPFITAGDPHPDQTVDMMHTLVAAGADIIELGIPFSDPMAEGPVIQKASERALQHGVSIHDVIDMVRRFRKQNEKTPVILMGYVNPIEVTGYEAFAKEAAGAGTDGVITVDMPPEEGVDYIGALKGEGLDPIFLLAPTSAEQRMESVGEASGGFVYYVSLRGVTGGGDPDLTEVADKIATIRRHVDLPVGVGFGINSPQTAARMARLADAVIVGSAVVKRVEAHGDNPQKMHSELTEFISSLRQALDEQ
ncbi:MAG: tryptophan synthase subunit alpha [Gammaproteobacteria bacterium]|nr:MAG: tryptophan synthase subunit alpha [Gammaproteobacteria bacterium]